MKKTKLFAFLSVFVVALGIFAASAFATDPAPSLSIKTLNLSVENAVYMVFKVADESVATEDMRLLVWEDVPNAYTKGTEDACLTSTEVEGGTGYTVFRYTDLAAKDMTKTVYACAYANVNGTDVYSAPVKYSIVMYADIQKEATDPDEDLVAFLDTMLTYGAAAQTYFEHNTDFLATDEVHKVTVVNGKLSDGFSLGWVKEGSTVTLVADEPEAGYVFSHWVNSKGESVGTTATLDVPVNGVDTYTATYLKYTFIHSDLGYAVNGYKGPVAEIEIPETYNDGKNGENVVYRVLRFANCSTLKEIKFSDNVTDIDFDAFSNCVNLSKVSFGENSKLRDIGSSAFSGCSSLTSIVIPKGVVNMFSAFANCTSLKSVVFEGAPRAISSGAFRGCTSLSSIELPDSVTRIQSEAFKGCTALNSINIPDNVTIIDEEAFRDCASLVSIAIPENVTSIEGWTFAGCSSLESVVISDNVTRIGKCAFAKCSNLGNVTFGENSKLTSIGESAFEHCSSFTNINIPDGVTSIGGRAFAFCWRVASVTFGENSKLTSIGESAFMLCVFTSIEIPASVTSIGEGAIDNGDLTSVTFGNTEGWWVTTDSSATSGTAVTVTDPAQNATYFKSTYHYYYWRRTE